MIRRITFIVTMGLMLSGINASAGDSGKETAAVSVAEKWLAMVDSEKYVESWQEAAKIFRVPDQRRGGKAELT